MLRLNHMCEIQSPQLSCGCSTPGISWYPTVPGQHIENSVKQTLPDQPHFSVLSHLQTNSNNRKLEGFAFPMIGHCFPPLPPALHFTLGLADLKACTGPGQHSKSSMHFPSSLLKYLVQLKCCCTESWEPSTEKQRTTFSFSPKQENI